MCLACRRRKTSAGRPAGGGAGGEYSGDAWVGRVGRVGGWGGHGSRGRCGEQAGCSVCAWLRGAAPAAVATYRVRHLQHWCHRWHQHQQQHWQHPQHPQPPPWRRLQHVGAGPARQRTILQWHQKRPGCSMPMPVQPLYGSSHISGVSGFMPSQLYTPSTASQNLPQEVE
jgi:hypothetical protein